MNNKITCGVCRDLLPLVKDGVANSDSEDLVMAHIAECGECAAMFGGKTPEPSAPKVLLRAKRWLTSVYAMLMILGLYFGLSLTAGSGVFFNCLIMPIVGVLGYLAFRWKAVYIVPIILVIVGFITNAMGFLQLDGVEHLDILSLISWIFIYALFALAGVVIAMLLHFAFGKTKKEGSGENER
ncbi:MAG: zf-HC2 domain-containing protein [Ruminococcaceae bacterium]|nr:zf-HC2 domain-containing protein [Oscillospiraceae bacterium]